MLAGGYKLRLGGPNLEDRAKFLQLWKRYLIEHHELGSDTPPTDGNILEFLRIYDSFTQGSLFGLCVLCETTEGEAVGTVLGGENPSGFNLQSGMPGRVFQLLGVYVDPGHRRRGLAWAMQDWGVPRAVPMGFTRMQSLVLHGYTQGEANAFGWGVRKVATVIEHDLSKPYGAQLRANRAAGHQRELAGASAALGSPKAGRRFAPPLPGAAGAAQHGPGEAPRGKKGTGAGPEGAGESQSEEKTNSRGAPTPG